MESPCRTVDSLGAMGPVTLSSLACQLPITCRQERSTKSPNSSRLHQIQDLADIGIRRNMW